MKDSALMRQEQDLFRLRVSTTYPGHVRGADLAFMCEADRGGTYYCKSDKPPRLIRATEWLLTHLASHLGIPTPECAVLTDREGRESYFGSLRVPSTALDSEVKAFLMTAAVDELGRPAEWLGGFLSRLYAFDMFVGNPDRGFYNFLLGREGLTRPLKVFDFASADLGGLAELKFPIASDATRIIGRLLRRGQPFVQRSAIEMLDRIAAVPSATVEGFLRLMPAEWMSEEQREIVCELWSKQRIEGRLEALRSGLTDESLL